MKSIAIDIGGTIIKMGFIEKNRVLDNETFSSLSQGDFSQTMSRVSEHISTLLERNKLVSAQLRGIGITIPGIVDVNSNKVLSINKKHDAAIQFNFNQWAKENWTQNLVMENDARAALVGEWQYGAGKKYNNIVMITLGTGIGGSALINGKLVYGKHFQAGCLGGHFIINYNGDKCTCGNIGCIESEASSWKLPELIRNHYLYPDSDWAREDLLDFEKLFNKYRENDALAIDVTQNCLKAWAAGAINMIHAYDPEIVIIGGGIMKSHDIIIPYIKQRTDKYAWTPCEKVEIKKAELENSAALLGLDYLLSIKLLNE